MQGRLTIRSNPRLMEHLTTFAVDGATVDSLLFEGGRLAYPGRKEIEYLLGYEEPYTLALEARVIEGISPQMAASIRTLGRFARTTSNDGRTDQIDSTLELLWLAHESWDRNGISLDRLVAALVGVNLALENKADDVIEDACAVLIKELHLLGFPPTHEGLEELFDGAPPACVGLGLVVL